MAIKLNRQDFDIDIRSLLEQVAKSAKIVSLAVSDNMVNYFGTSWNNQKELFFVQNINDYPSGILSIKAETMSTFGTTNVGLFLDDESDPRKILSTVGTNFQLLTGTAYIGDLADGVHKINISLQNLDLGTSYQKLLEIHIVSG